MLKKVDFKLQFARLSIVTIVFDHALSFGKFISFPILFSFLFLISNQLSIKKEGYSLKLLLVILLLLTFIIFCSGINSQKISNEVIFFQGFRVFFYFSYFIFFSSVLLRTYRIEKLIGWLYVSFIIATVFGLIYFISQNFLGIDLDSFIYRPSVIENSGSVSSTFRNRSFFEEAGNFSFYLNLVFPIILFGFGYENKKFKLYTLVILYFISILTTFSATGIVVSFLISLLISFRKKVIAGVNITHLFRMLTTCILGGVIYLYFSGDEFVNFAVNKISAKVFLDSQNSSASARLDGITLGYNYLNALYHKGNYLTILIGSGPGASQYLFDISIVSGQLSLLIDLGLLPMVILYILFFRFCYINYIKSYNVIFYSGLAFFIYQFLITNYASMFVVVSLSILLEITREKTNRNYSVL